MKTILALILFLVVISCCKEPVIPDNSMIGEWRVVKVDSLAYIETHDFYLIQSFADTCTIHFFSDSTGRFNQPFRSLSGPEIDFRWAYNDTSDRMDLSFANGVTNGFITGEFTDTIKFYIRDYLSPPRFSLTRYYCLYLIKN